jgi:hypothetical protein
MLDFVPNHTALDHFWVAAHPEYYVAATAADLQREPSNYVRLPSGEIFAHGRDPYFPGWSDTLQLDYANRATRQAMQGELLRIASQCDGVRCDMAMLVLPEVFTRTWGRPAEPFWPATIEHVKQAVPGFCLLAEVYWDLEWTLQQQGFDYTYDKRLYDRLRAKQARPVRDHFIARLDYQDRMARFLENHDEARAAANFPPAIARAAAVLTYTSPGLRFFQAGQFEGARVHASPHLGRVPVEPVNAEIQQFYARFLRVLKRPVLRAGNWRLLNCNAAWEGNNSDGDLIAFSWDQPGEERLLIAVNYAPHQSQGYVHPQFDNLQGRTWRLTDLLGSEVYLRSGDELRSRGLYLDVPPWYAAAFLLEAA